VKKGRIRILEAKSFGSGRIRIRHTGKNLYFILIVMQMKKEKEKGDAQVRTI